MKGFATKKKSMFAFVPDSTGNTENEEDGEEEEVSKHFSTSDFNKLDYTLPATASQIFRNNFIPKTLGLSKKKKEQ